jgi:hypothetical protein
MWIGETKVQNTSIQFPPLLHPLDVLSILSTLSIPAMRDWRTHDGPHFHFTWQEVSMTSRSMTSTMMNRVLGDGRNLSTSDSGL